MRQLEFIETIRFPKVVAFARKRVSDSIAHTPRTDEDNGGSMAAVGICSRWE